MRALTALFLAGTALFLDPVGVLPAKAQSCTIGVNQPGPWYSSGYLHSWATNHTIRVWIDPSFPSVAREGIVAALWNWTNQASSNRTEIIFTVTDAYDSFGNDFLEIRRVSRAEIGATANVGATSWQSAEDTYRIGRATMRIDSAISDEHFMSVTVAHEIGHTMGLDDCGSCGKTSTVMITGVLLNAGEGLTGPSECDNQEVDYLLPDRASCETNPPCNYDPSSYCSPDPCRYAEPPHCPIGWVQDTGAYGICCLNPGSPIIIDIGGDGFLLTEPELGPLFDLYGLGTKVRVSWTSPASLDGWLVLDRNGNGTIDDGTELFGNWTPQPPSSNPNGFLALEVFDRVANGGNGNGWIDCGDAIWKSLRIWSDINNNGVSESSELSTLDAHGLIGIDLKFQESKWSDAVGNRFRFRSKTASAKDGYAGKWVYDVYLRVAKP